jgi:hypothetical protein
MSDDGHEYVESDEEREVTALELATESRKLNHSSVVEGGHVSIVQHEDEDDIMASFREEVAALSEEPLESSHELSEEERQFEIDDLILKGIERQSAKRARENAHENNGPSSEEEEEDDWRSKSV